MNKRNNNTYEHNRIGVMTVIIAYLVFRILITGKLGMQGSAYLFTAVDILVMMLIMVPFAVKHSVSRLCRIKLKNGQSGNALRVLYGGLIVIIIYSILATVLLLILKKPICRLFLFGKNSYKIYMWLLPCIFVIGMIDYFKGFLLGIRDHASYIFVTLFHIIAMLISSLIFISIYEKKGMVVSEVLYNRELIFAYSATGGAIGIFLGSVLTLILCIIFYYFKKNIILQGSSKHTDDIYDVLGWIKLDILKNAIPLITLFICNIGIQTVFFEGNGEFPREVTTYQWGAYAGPFFNIMLLPFLILFAYSFMCKHDLKAGLRGNSISELRVKVEDMYHEAILIGIPFASFIAFNAKPILEGINKMNFDFGISYVRMAAPAVILLCLVVVSTNILAGLGQYFVCFFNCGIAAIFSIVVDVLCVNSFKLGMSSSVIALYLFGLSATILNYLSVKKTIKFTPEVLLFTIRPLIVSVVAGFVTFLIGLLLSMFMPAWSICLVLSVIYLIIVFVALVKLSVINSYTLSGSLIGGLFMILGKTFNIL